MGMTIGLTMNATEMSRRMSGMGGPPPQGRGGPDQLIEDAAKAIGISKGDLQSQLKSGASIADVAKASGVALDDMKSRMSETISARLSTAVSGGGLTKTDADAMKADMSPWRRRACEDREAGNVRQGHHPLHRAGPAGVGSNSLPTSLRRRELPSPHCSQTLHRASRFPTWRRQTERRPIRSRHPCLST